MAQNVTVEGFDPSENGKFHVVWTRRGKSNVRGVDGIGELSEFIRNCNAYERVLVSVEVARHA